jgi:hypothetical protein
MLNVIMLSVVMPNVVTPNVMAPILTSDFRDRFCIKLVRLSADTNFFIIKLSEIEDTLFIKN